MCFIYKGMVRQFYFKNNKDLTEHFAYENSFFFCIESFLRKVPSEILVEAIEPTILYGLPHDRFIELAARNGRWTWSVSRPPMSAMPGC